MPSRRVKYRSCKERDLQRTYVSDLAEGEEVIEMLNYKSKLLSRYLAGFQQPAASAPLSVPCVYSSAQS